jgi:hypothetical protein
VSVSETPPRLAVRTVDDLVGLVPYLIGFPPRDSLVVIVLCEGRVEVTARVDLAEMAAPDGLAYLFGRLFSRFPAAETWCLAYSDDEQLAWDVLSGCAVLCGAIRLARVVHVGSDGWRADSPDGECGSAGVSATAVEAVVMGLPVRRSRAELQALVAGPDDADVDDLFELFERIVTEVDELSRRSQRRLLHRLLRRSGERGRADWVRLAVLVAKPETAVGLLSGLQSEDAAHLVTVWTQVVRHCLVPYLPTPLGLLGMAAWLTGDGAMAAVCLERIGRIDPGGPMADLLGLIIAEVVPPTSWPDCRSELVSELSARFGVGGPE